MGWLWFALMVSGLKFVASYHSQLNEDELKLKYSVVDIGKPIQCHNPTQNGDNIELSLRAFSPVAEQFLHEKFGKVIDIVSQEERVVQQNAIVGQHSIKPLNQALLNLCIGSQRRVGIPIFGTKIYYELKILDINKRSAGESTQSHVTAPTKAEEL